MTNQQEIFINRVAECVKRYAPQYNIVVYSPIIAQAILESNFGTCELSKYNNFFGLKCGGSWKGKSINVKTKEFYNGNSVNITDNFRVFDTFEDGIKGYFDFINWSNYSNLKNCYSVVDYCNNLSKDGYATSPTYSKELLDVINCYKLIKYDIQGDCVMDKKFIKGIQTFLNYMGFNCGEVDGIVGNKTISAWCDFLRSL